MLLLTTLAVRQEAYGQAQAVTCKEVVALRVTRVLLFFSFGLTVLELEPETLTHQARAALS